MRVLITGFPGLIAGPLLPALAERNPKATFALLVEEAMIDRARTDLERWRIPYHRVELVTGDLTAQGLGVAGGAERLKDVTHVWHLGALQDPRANETHALRVNLEGTAQVLDLCEALPLLERVMYFSCCLVAGDRTGLVREDQLHVGQRHRDAYELSKYRAEAEARSRRERLPITIVRPALVVGDSRTGEAEREDPPGALLAWLARAPDDAAVPGIDGGTGLLNVVPIDYVIAAAIALSEIPAAIGETCHLADANPTTVHRFLLEACTLLGRPWPRRRAPLWLAELAGGLPALSRRAPKRPQALTLRDERVLYDTSNAKRLLAGTGLCCPPVASYLPALVRSAERHARALSA